ncbi:MAG: diacylglycerol kinase family protein [Rothia sp. (in: high G+C Gram-positive bacteria)]|nr:diacylglycerol kinase family protein [Rothia sp. (in: high G+C Gram-positive bacteria)]
MRIRKKQLALRALILGSGYTLISWLLTKTNQQKRPDLFPVYRPWHLMLPATEAKKVAVIFNPTKKNALYGCKVVRDQVAQAGWAEPIFYETTAADAGYGMATDALSQGAELVIAIGGDGTVRQVATALAGQSAALGIVPLGTGNLLARNLGLEYWDIAACVNAALHGQVLAIDMLKLRLVSGQGQVQESSIMVMGGAGYDAQIMTDTSEDLKAKLGWLAYLTSGIRNLLAPRHLVEIRLDQGPAFQRRFRSVLVANCGELQGGINLASTVHLRDGQLEVIVLSPRNLMGWLRLLARFLLGPSRLKQPRPVLEHFVGAQVNMDFLDAPQLVQVDGDVVGRVQSLQAVLQAEAVKVCLYPQDQPRIRPLAQIPQELIDSRSRLQQQLADSTDILIQEFLDSAEQRSEKVRRWFEQSGPKNPSA